MAGRFQGKVALVTGGARGIGKATCERFGREGCAVVVTDFLDDEGEAVAKSIREAKGPRGVRSPRRSLGSRVEQGRGADA